MGIEVSGIRVYETRDGAGYELKPPEGTVVVPLLVSQELAAELYADPEPLSGCGAMVEFEELDSGFTGMTIHRGDPDCDE